jgi:hypothetical protein
MEVLYNGYYIMLLLFSNIIAIMQLIAAIKWPHVARFSFFILFGCACWVNFSLSQKTPKVYLDYADVTWSSWYRYFISNWFAQHTRLAVGFIATCQGLIAISMLLRGFILKTGYIGAIVFLISVLPLGLGSSFPCTGIMAAAIFVLLKKYNNKYALKKHVYLSTEFN